MFEAPAWVSRWMWEGFLWVMEAGVGNEDVLQPQEGGGGGGCPPQDPDFMVGGGMNFGEGKIELGHFWCTKVGVQGPPTPVLFLGAGGGGGLPPAFIPNPMGGPPTPPSTRGGFPPQVHIHTPGSTNQHSHSTLMPPPPPRPLSSLLVHAWLEIQGLGLCCPFAAAADQSPEKDYKHVLEEREGALGPGKLCTKNGPTRFSLL